MEIKIGNMWDAYNEADLFLITTNSTLYGHKLAMGAGIALEANQRFKGLDLALGERIEPFGVYGLLVSENWPTAKLGAFQTKIDATKSSYLWLIHYSALLLDQFIRKNKVLMVHLNFPGIGYGHLAEEHVLPKIEFLPDNVIIWKTE